MQKAVNDVINIFASDEMETDTPLVILHRHYHLYIMPVARGGEGGTAPPRKILAPLEKF